jgi:hypothetical protein
MSHWMVDTSHAQKECTEGTVCCYRSCWHPANSVYVGDVFLLLLFVFLQPKCWWEVEQQDAAQPANQQQQQQQVPGASDSQHVVKLMADRVRDKLSVSPPPPKKNS